MVKPSADRRAFLATGAGGLLVLTLAAAVEFVPWGIRGIAPAGADGLPVIGTGSPWEVGIVALAQVAAMLVSGGVVLGMLMRSSVETWSRRRRLATFSFFAAVMGVCRVTALILVLPVGVTGAFVAIETAIGAAEAFVALGLANHYLGTRRRIRREERLRAQESNARAEMQRQELRSRREVSQRLHGGVQQRLVAAISELDALRDELETRGETPSAQAVTDVAATLDRVREDEVRMLAHALYPLVADIELRAALLLLGDQLPARVRMEVTYAAAAEVLAGADLAIEYREVVFQIIEEAVTNAIRHGGAERIGVALDAAPAPGGRTRVTITVDDDGAGLGTGAPELSGLARLRTRARLHGGDLTLGASPAGGVRLTALLSVTVAAHGAGALR